MFLGLGVNLASNPVAAATGTVTELLNMDFSNLTTHPGVDIDAETFLADGTGFTNLAMDGGGTYGYINAGTAGQKVEFVAQPNVGGVTNKASFKDSWRVVTNYPAAGIGDVVSSTCVMTLPAAPAGLYIMDIEQLILVTDGGNIPGLGLRLVVGGDGKLFVDRSELQGLDADMTALVGASAVPTVSPVAIRWDILVHPTAGYCKVYIDGVLHLDETGRTIFEDATFLANTGLTITGVKEYDSFETGITAMSNSIAAAKTLLLTSSAVYLTQNS